MSEPNEVVNSTTEPVKEPASYIQDIRSAIKYGLVKANEHVRAAIVKSETEKELTRRVEATAKVITKIEELEVERRKIKPTFQGKKLDGSNVGEEFYTDEQVKAVKENQEKLARLTKALEAALDKNDFTKVLELGGK